MKVEDNAFLSLRTAANQMAWLHASWTEWKNCFSFEIFGRDGKLQVDGLGGSYGRETIPSSISILQSSVLPSAEFVSYSR